MKYQVIFTLGEFSAGNILKYLSYFSQKTGFDISCELSQTRMKGQILLSRKNKKNVTNLSSAELDQRMVKGNN